MLHPAIGQIGQFGFGQIWEINAPMCKQMLLFSEKLPFS
jgi:hypothetical protein